MKNLLRVFTFVLFAPALAQAPFMPLAQGVKHQATAPPLTAGTCLPSASPDILADDTGILYTCVGTSYVALPALPGVTGGAGINVTGGVISTASEEAGFISSAATACTTSLFGAMFQNTIGFYPPYICKDDDDGWVYQWYVPYGTSDGRSLSATYIQTSTSADTTASILFADSPGTGTLDLAQTDPGITYNATTNVLTVGGFVGNLNPTAATTDTASYIAMFDSPATTAGAIKTDTGLVWNATTDALTATSFVGAGGGLTLTATGFNGNLTTTDDTVQEVAQKLDDFVVTGGAGIAVTGTSIATASGEGGFLDQLSAVNCSSAGDGAMSVDYGTGVAKVCADGSSYYFARASNEFGGSLSLALTGAPWFTSIFDSASSIGEVLLITSANVATWEPGGSVPIVATGFNGNLTTTDDTVQEVAQKLDDFVEADGSTTNELQNIFQTVATTSGTSPVADTTTDTLTLTAGSGITITGDSATDTVTIAATGGGGGAPTTTDYLVGTADAGLSAEIVVGTSPGGSLGGTWASPTVDNDSHFHDRHMAGKQYWTFLDRTAYDSNLDATNDVTTWPGYTGTAAPGRVTLVNIAADTSGVVWSEKYQVWIVAVNNVQDIDGDATADDQIGIYQQNGTLIWGGPAAVTSDLEGVTLTSPTSDYFYVIDERLNNNQITEYSIPALLATANGTAATAIKTWDIASVDTPNCLSGSNGYEGLTFIPDRTQCTDYTATGMPCGYFLALCQVTGGFYKFRLDNAAPVQISGNTNTTTCTLTDTTTDGDGLDYDFRTGYIWETIGGAQDKIAVFDTAFNCAAVFTAPNTGEDYEGIAIGPEGTIALCSDGTGDCFAYQVPFTNLRAGSPLPFIRKSCTQTAEGEQCWDADNDTLQIGSGASTKTLLDTAAISDTAYAGSWDAVTTIAPSKNAVYDQMQLMAPLVSPTFTGTVTIPTPFTLAAVSVLPTGTELNYVDGVTSAIQGQIDAKTTLAAVKALVKVECVTLYDRTALETGDDLPSIWKAPAAVTVTEVWCETDDANGTVMNLQRDDGTPANVLSSNKTCTSTAGTGTIDAAEDNFADGERLDLVIVSFPGTASKRLNICIEYTYD